MLLSGKPPFDGGTGREIMENIKKMHWNFSPDFNNVSRRAKSFIMACLSTVSHRPTAEEAAHHSWFNLLHEHSDTEAEGISTETVTRLKNFGSRNMLSRVCMEVVAHTMQPDQIEGLKKEFGALDNDNAGIISFKDLHAVLKTTGRFSDEDMEKIFRDVNFDQSGEINYHEFVAATMSRTTIREQNLKMAFYKISNNADYFTEDDLSRLAGIDSNPEKVKFYFVFF
jgi:calcium-dependent protein kinase